MDDAVAVREHLNALVDDVRRIRRAFHHLGIDGQTVRPRTAAALGVDGRGDDQRGDERHVFAHGLLLHTYCTRRAARARPSWPIRTSARTIPAADGMSS